MTQEQPTEENANPCYDPLDNCGCLFVYVGIIVTSVAALAAILWMTYVP